MHAYACIHDACIHPCSPRLNVAAQRTCCQRSAATAAAAAAAVFGSPPSPPLFMLFYLNSTSPPTSRPHTAPLRRLLRLSLGPQESSARGRAGGRRSRRAGGRWQTAQGRAPRPGGWGAVGVGSGGELVGCHGLVGAGSAGGAKQVRAPREQLRSLLRGDGEPAARREATDKTDTPPPPPCLLSRAQCRDSLLV